MASTSTSNDASPSCDEMLFNIFGPYVFGGLGVPGLSAQLAELLLPNTKSKTWSDFIITAGEQHEDFGKGRADSDMDLDALPLVESDEVRDWWARLKEQPSQPTWSQLSTRTHSSQLPKSNASAQDLQPSGSARPHARMVMPGDLALEEDEDDGLHDRKKRRRRPSSRMSGFDTSDLELELEEKRPRTMKRSKTKPSKSKGKGKALRRSRSRSLSRSPRPKRMSALEQKEMRAARKGRSADSDFESDEEDGDIRDLTDDEDALEAELTLSRFSKSTAGPSQARPRVSTGKDASRPIYVDDLSKVQRRL
ncbi:hypothetical protein V8E36_005247 [Tilletia maclaganii]